MEKDIILSLYQKPHTVFSTAEIAMLFPEVSYENLKRRLSYYVKRGKLQKVRRGLYVKEGYSNLELAGKLFIPSYISLETVLQREGVIFQYYAGIYAVSYLSRVVTIDGRTYTYRRIHPEILVNTAGIEEKDGCAIASKERAFLDAVYLFKDYYFDNIMGINWDMAMEYAKIYQSKILEKRVLGYYKLYKEENG